MKHIRRVPMLTRCSQEKITIADGHYLVEILPNSLNHSAGGDAGPVDPILTTALEDEGSIRKSGGHSQLVPVYVHGLAKETDFWICRK